MNVSKIIVMPLLVLSLYVTSCRFMNNGPDGNKREEQASSGNPNDLSQKASDDSGNPKPEGRGGIIDGNTGELITTENNPWFIGKEAVPYCIKIGSTFSLNQSEASKEIRDAFSTWTKVFPMLLQYGSVPSDFELPADLFPLQVATKFTEVTCDKNPPLVFKLGDLDDEVRAVLPFTAEHTIGFARRTDYDVKTGQGRGYIWIASDRGDQRYRGEGIAEGFWKRHGVFYNIIAHEIGHVLGFSHIRKTIMDANLPAGLLSSSEKWIWSGTEFSWSKEFPGDFCGDLVTSNDGGLLKDMFGIESSENLQMCTRFAAGIGGEGSKYALELTIKKANETLAQKIADVSLFDGTRQKISGQYLRKNAASGQRYVAFDFNDFYTSSSFKGVLRGSNGPQPLLIERDQPLSFTIRVPHKGEWKLLILIDSAHWEAQVTLGRIVGDQ